jgi:hypothetical protein
LEGLVDRRLGDNGLVAAVDVNDPGHPENKHRTRESGRQARELLLGWDPIGIAENAAAADEYDCMISPLLHQLHDGTSERELRRWLKAEVEDHFGMRADRRRERRLAAELISWWTERSSSPPV